MSTVIANKKEESEFRQQLWFTLYLDQVNACTAQFVSDLLGTTELFFS